MVNVWGGECLGGERLTIILYIYVYYILYIINKQVRWFMQPCFFGNAIQNVVVLWEDLNVMWFCDFCE